MARHHESSAGRPFTIAELADAAGPVRSALATLGGTWSILTLACLQDGPMRYGELNRTIEGISDRMLIKTLRRFEEDGLVERRVLATIPAHVEYELTDLGRRAAEALMAFACVIVELAPQVAAARERAAATGR